MTTTSNVRSDGPTPSEATTALNHRSAKGPAHSGAGLRLDLSNTELADPFAEIFAAIAAGPSIPPETTVPEYASSTPEDEREFDPGPDPESTDDDQATTQPELIRTVAVESTPLALVDDAVTDSAPEPVEAPQVKVRSSDAETPVEIESGTDVEVNANTTTIESVDDEADTPLLAPSTEADTAAQPVTTSVASSKGETPKSRRTSDENPVPVEFEQPRANELLKQTHSENPDAKRTVAERAPSDAQTTPTAQKVHTESRVEQRRYTRGNDLTGPNPNEPPARRPEAPAHSQGGTRRSSTPHPVQPEISELLSNPTSRSSATVTLASLASASPANGAARLSSVSAGATSSLHAGRPAGQVSGAGVAAENPVSTTSAIADKPSRGSVDRSSKSLALMDRVKLVNRVSRAFQSIGQSGGEIRLRLAPAQLGSVRLDLRVEDRNLTGRMVAESETAANALREHIPELRQSLERQGIRLDSIEIQTEAEAERQARYQPGSDGGSRQRDSQHPNSQSRERGHQSPTADPVPTKGPTTEATANASVSSMHAGVELDLRF
ncbi:MAG: flagellar hook-length control protein FliK [Planctomycetota bacterium]